jgi:hypothetical protein
MSVDRTVEAAAFEALLVPAVLKPVSDTLGPLGSVFADVVARAAIERLGGAR